MKNSILFLILFFSISSIMTVQGKSKNSGEKIFTQNADQALAMIQEAAEKISIKGVAIIGFIPGEKSESWITKMKVVGHMTNEKDNMLGIAYSKASEMADTHQNSGSGLRAVYRGELGYQGGLIQKVNSGYILAVFSGGASEQDLVVAKIGLDWLCKLYGN